MSDVLVGPTRARLAKAEDFYLPNATAKRKTVTFRCLDAIEALHRNGEITDGQSQAFKYFESTFVAVHRSIGVCNYAGIAPGAVTPVNQLASWLLKDEEAAEHSRLTVSAAVRDAARAVGHPKQLGALLLVITEPVNLEDIGLRVLGIRNKPQARARAAATLDAGTFSLARHYGYIRDDIPAAPRPG